jgi:hypothetical protein
VVWRLRYVRWFSGLLSRCLYQTSTLETDSATLTEQHPNTLSCNRFNELRPADGFDVIAWRRRIPKPTAFVAGFRPTLRFLHNSSFTWPLEPQVLSYAMPSSIACWQWRFVQVSCAAEDISEMPALGDQYLWREL